MNYSEKNFKKNLIKYSKVIFFFIALVLTALRDILIYIFDGNSETVDNETSEDLKNEPTLMDKSNPASEEHDILYDPSFNQGAPYGWSHSFYDPDHEEGNP